MAEVQLHRCRFLDYERPYVTALEFSMPSPGLKTHPSEDLRLAVGRSNGDIEIWNPRHNWYVDTVLLGSRDRSIEDLAWCQSDGKLRLFSVGASDAVTEWDLSVGQPMHHVRADAGVIWALEVSPDNSKLAVACETGTIVVFDISDGPGNITFFKRLQHTDASLASLTWLTNNTLAAGSSDARVRVWSLDTGRLVASMKVDKAKGGDQTFVWSLLSLRNGAQIVSGDSNGFIKIWDGKTFSLQQSFQAHPSDVLCMTADAAGETIFSSGLDQKIVCSKMTDSRHKRWTVMSNKVANSHDVRCIASYEGKGLSFLVSGGLERTIAVNSVTHFNQKPSRKIPLTRYQPTVEVTSNKFLILEWREQTVRLWQLNGESKKLVAELNLNKEEEYISCASFSAEHELLAVATGSTIKIFKVAGARKGKVTAITLEPNEELAAIGGAKLAKFSEGKLVFVTPENEIFIYSVADKGLVEVEVPNVVRNVKSAIPYANDAKLLSISEHGEYFAVARHNRYIEIYSIKNTAFAGQLPAVGEFITAMTFKRNDNLTVMTSDMCLYEFTIDSLTLSDWSREHSERLPSVLSRQTTACCGLFNDPENNDKLWLWGPTWLAFLNFATTKPYRKSTKRKAGSEAAAVAAVNDDPELNGDIEQAFWLTNKFRPLFYAGVVGQDILISERPATGAQDVKPFWSNRHIQI